MSNRDHVWYGAMGLGGSSWDAADRLTDRDIAEGAEVLDAVLDLGITRIDLADIYHQGKSELVVGEYLKRHLGLRERLTIQSKVGIRLTGSTFGSRFDFSYDHIISSVDGILERLGTNYLDSLLLHRPDPLMERSEIKDAIDRLFDDKKIRAIGVSNMSKEQIELLELYTGRHMVANQLELSLKKHDFVSSAVGFNNAPITDFPIGTIEYCMTHDVALQSWSPLARGVYTGRPADERTPATAGAVTRVVNRIAQEQSVAPEGVVMAWLLRHPAQIEPVIGTTTIPRIRACMQGYDVTLSRDQWYELLVAARGVPMP
ncbi:MAG: aldo/keto reductase [Spirochaetia bacterium]|nr:aldo/keto reductase [Spirochaetia bacterium]MCF7940776.1 aldo/keto reductase [Spirochaetia bacterium]